MGRYKAILVTVYSPLHARTYLGPCCACDIQVQLASRHLLKAQCKKVYIASHINILHLGFNHGDFTKGFCLEDVFDEFIILMGKTTRKEF